jgi:citrate synthase
MSTPTYSPGLEGVIAGETAVCTVEEGLSYRGYFVGDLAAHCTFDEVAFLLLHGELPNAAQLKAFQDRVAAARRVPPPFRDLLAALPKWTTPLDALRTVVSGLAHFDPDVNDNSHEANVRKAGDCRSLCPEPRGHADRGPARPQPFGEFPLHAPRC